MKTAFCSLFVTGLLLAPMAQATVFKCKNSKNEITYQSTACNEGDSTETIKIIGAPIFRTAVNPGIEGRRNYKKKVPGQAQKPNSPNRSEQQAQNDENE